MDNNIDNEMKDFEQQIANNLRHDLDDEKTPRQKGFLDFIPQRKILILGGIGALVLIVLIAIFFGGDDNLSKKDLTSLKTRLDLLEERLTRFEGVELRVASLEKKDNELKQSMAEIDRSKKLLTQRYNDLAQRLEKLNKEKSTVPKKAESSMAVQKKQIPLSEKRFHKVSPGETLYRISNKYGITVEELCRLNNIGKDTTIQPGQKLLVSHGSKK